MSKLLFILCGVILVPFLAFAQDSSQFLVQVVGGEDNEPPTTPTLLSVVPTASTQIDIEWSTSTDNTILSGYVLLRNSIAIATTSLTSFMDTGLTPETLYTYEVYAFDGFYNLSTTSNALATTTLAAPVPEPVATTTDSSVSSTQLLRLIQSTVVPATNSVLFSWETNIASRFTLRWGRSDMYDEGYIINDTYRREHQTIVTDLEPGTVYVYELIGYTPNGRPITLESGEFKTLVRENLVPPNVSDLWLEVEGVDATLYWTLPPSLLDARVRIVRSYLGYPNDPYDGAVVYEGQATSFFDEGALSLYEEQFYTVFVITEDGSVSSGAVVRASNKKDGDPLLEEELIDIEDFDFSVANINLHQGSETFNFKSSRITLSGNEPFVVSIPYEALPRNLKSIVVTLLDPTDHTRSYSFLLRINKDRTAYEATVAALGVEGISRIQVEIFDYERKIIGRYRKQVDFLLTKGEYSEVVFPDLIVKTIKPYFPVISIAFVGPLFWMFIVYRRSRETEDNL